MASTDASKEPLLRVQNLVTTFRTEQGSMRAVDLVSFDVQEGATLGIVGESGCGKSVTALSILRLVSAPQGKIESGKIEFRGHDLLQLSEREMQDIRGNEISMVFQEPMTALNPVYTVGSQIIEAIRLHQKVSRREAYIRTIELLRLVGIASPDTNVDAYPHQLSGGMRQRVVIAMALACEPRLLIADEPTTALDVTIQAQILELLGTLKTKLSMAVVLITHDLGVVAEVCTEVAVMYAGHIVEIASATSLFARPRHPYTQGLLRCLPTFDKAVLDAPATAERDSLLAIPNETVPVPSARQRLATIEGLVPNPFTRGAGCRFADRCSLVLPACTDADPVLQPVDDFDAPRPHLSRCIRANDL